MASDDEFVPSRGCTPSANAAGSGRLTRWVSLVKPLGLVLEDTDEGGVYVESLQTGGAAHLSGMIHPGDVLLTVAGHDVTRSDVDAVLALVASASSDVVLTVSSSTATCRHETRPCSQMFPRPPESSILFPSEVSFPSSDLPSQFSMGSCVLPENSAARPAVQYVETQPSSRGVVKVTLTKPLGVELEDCEQQGVYVSVVQTGGAAALSSRVQVGDVLLFVNGVDVSSSDVDAVLELVQAARATVTLTLARPVQAQGVACRARPDVSRLARLEVMLPKPLGIVLEDCENTGVRVDALQPGGAAHMGGLLQVGDILLAVNGQDVSACDCDAVVEIMGPPPGFVTLCVGRALK